MIALKGAPARYPVEEQYSPLHKYLQWAEDVEDETDHYIRNTFQGEKFIGIHLRNDLDWVSDAIGKKTYMKGDFRGKLDSPHL